jgi:20S proteasome alpha/beta subunit
MSSPVLPREPVDFQRPHPYPHVRPNKDELVEKKAVTIVVGFRCSDGIVICADRQITASGAFKYHQTKISSEEFDTFTAVFAYAGLPGIAKEVHDKIASLLRQLTLEDTAIRTVQETTDSVLSAMGRLYTDLNLQMLIGVTSQNEGADLLKFDGKAVHPAENFNYLAYGESSLIRFLSEKLYSKEMNTKTGMDLGIYLVKKAEDYIDGCGGPIDVVILDQSERSTHWFSQKVIQERLQKMEMQERLLTDLLIRKPFSST